MSAVPASPTTAASISFSSMMQEPIKPNPHPYAIRTTSTGVLSRSNSSGRNLAASHHHYIPLPPSPTKREAKRHRPAKSFSSASSYPNSRHPQSLPAPPEFTSNAILPKRTRAETLPSLSPADTNSTSFFASAELPANPKLWTVSQLSFYLLGALRLPSRAPECGDPLPVAVVQDVTTILRQAQINGRHFLRLNEEDLERYVSASLAVLLDNDLTDRLPVSVSIRSGARHCWTHHALCDRVRSRVKYGDLI